MADTNIEILKKGTLIQLVRNSVDSTLFRSLMVRRKDSGEVVDILKNGEYSCAYFVSSLLYITDFINKPRATVASTERYLSEHWEKITLEDSQEGDVVVWEKMLFPSGEEHAHIGFIVHPNEAISTNDSLKCVERHFIDKKGRKVSSVYRCPEDI